MDSTILVAIIGAIAPIISAVAVLATNCKHNKKTDAKMDILSTSVQHTEEELRKQGEMLAKQDRAFRERKKHEELQSKLEITNLEATQVILEALHKSGAVNGDCEIHRNKLNDLKSEMAAQALHLEDDDIKY